MSEQRPFGSYDWNHNGEYNLFDKITDRYVYSKMLEYLDLVLISILPLKIISRKNWCAFLKRCAGKPVT